MDTFLSEIGTGAEARVRRDLQRLSERGNELRYPKTDSLGDGLFELRTDFSGMIYRNIFFYREGMEIVIVESFNKKQQKTPKKHLDNAKSRRDAIIKGEFEVGSLKSD